MLGTRGCRLGILKPGLYRMQVKALIQAAVSAQAGRRRPARRDHDPADRHRARARAARPTGCARSPTTVLRRGRRRAVDYLVGTMIETPRAALVAGEIAEVAEFFSFGTNDLTQMTFGFSRDDVEGRFMSEYLELKLLPANPFETLDAKASASSCASAVERGRAARPDLKLGICGEHGGDPESVAFCHEVGLDYVSCSPYRVPIARLAAAATPRSATAGPARPPDRREVTTQHDPPRLSASSPEHVAARAGGGRAPGSARRPDARRSAAPRSRWLPTIVDAELDVRAARRVDRPGATRSSRPDAGDRTRRRHARRDAPVGIVHLYSRCGGRPAGAGVPR